MNTDPKPWIKYTVITLVYKNFSGKDATWISVADPGSGAFFDPRIRDLGSCQPWIPDPVWKNSDPKSGINIPDPQHCALYTVKFLQTWLKTWKGHQPLQAVDFLILILNIWKEFKVLRCFIQNTSNPTTALLWYIGFMVTNRNLFRQTGLQKCGRVYNCSWDYRTARE